MAPILLDLDDDVAVALIAVDQLARHLERGPIAIVAFPERQHAPDPVELIVRDRRGHEVAVEHTLVEPWEGAVRDAKWMHDLFPGYRFTDPRMPPGSFRLGVPRGALQGIRNGMKAGAREAVIEWAVRIAPTLSEPDPPRPGHFARSEGLTPFEVTLSRGADGTEPSHFVEVVLGFWEDDNRRYELRCERMRRAIDSKHPKLLAHRRYGRSTVLVLEFNNLSMDNEDIIEQVYRRELGNRDAPDHLVIVATIDKSWPVHWFPLVDGQWHDPDEHAPMRQTRLS